MLKGFSWLCDMPWFGRIDEGFYELYLLLIIDEGKYYCYCDSNLSLICLFNLITTSSYDST